MGGFLQWAILIGGVYWLAKHGLLLLALAVAGYWALGYTWWKTRHWTDAQHRAFWRTAYGPIPGARRKRRP